MRKSECARTQAVVAPPDASPPLRIGIDGDALRTPISGVGQYVFQLCLELETLLPTAEFYAYSRLAADRLALPSTRWALRQELNPLWRKVPSFLWLKTRGAKLCKRDRLHAFWAGRTLHPQLPAPTRTVVTVHDLNHLLVPETMERPTLWSNRLWFASDVMSADVVVANSCGTAQRLLHWINRRADAVVTPGVAASFKPLSKDERGAALISLGRLGIKPPYLLCVGTLKPRKNVGALLTAYQNLRSSGQLANYQLVLVGSQGWQNKALSKALRNTPGVVVTGFVPDCDLPALYALSELLICPSIYEGFGMPVLEARASGTRLLVNDLPELREAAGRGANVMGSSPRSIAEGIQAALSRPWPEVFAPPVLESWVTGAKILAESLVSDYRLSKASP